MVSLPTVDTDTEKNQFHGFLLLFFLWECGRYESQASCEKVSAFLTAPVR
jgi:hypothetical protein